MLGLKCTLGKKERNTLKKLLLVYNPIAGKMFFACKLNEVIEYFTKQNYVVTVYPTQACKDGYNFVKACIHEFDLIVCAGGDGTLNEIVSSVLASGVNRSVGYIPCGSTNDFAQTIGIPEKLEAALEVSCNGEPIGLDVGCFNDKYFVYVAGFGLFTNVSYSTPQKMKNSLGHIAYILEGIKALSEIKAYSLMLEHDNGIVRGNFIMGLIMNSFSVGGFKSPFHKLTKLDDGLFELILIKMPNSIVDLQKIVVDLLNANVNSEYIIYIQTTCVRIKSEQLEWTLDGEYGGSFEEVKVYNKNKAIKIMTKPMTSSA